MFSTKIPDLTPREQKNKQIKDWNGSDFEKASSEYHPPKKIKFPLGVSLIAACCSDDKEEFKRLLDLGVDINTRNPDGMTCVHQCCINGDYEFLEFLIKEGADLNVQDNEGWTPLHAAASVGYGELVRLLLNNGADVSLLSCETELPIDVTQDAEVTEVLNEAMRERGVDPVTARQTEAVALLNDAKHWVSLGKYDPIVDPRTGATPLHVAACKDYLDVLQLLLTVPGVDINCQDLDGWTPLHAAAHWNREQSARFLVEAGASFDVYTFTNQSVFDVADKQIVLSLRQLRERQRSQKHLSASSVTASSTKAERTLSPIPVDSSSSSEESDDGSHEDNTSDLTTKVHTPAAAGDVKLNGTSAPEPVGADSSKRTSPPSLPRSPVPQPSFIPEPTRTQLDKESLDVKADSTAAVPHKRPSPPLLSMINGSRKEDNKSSAASDQVEQHIDHTSATTGIPTVAERLRKAGRDHSPPPPPPRPAYPLVFNVTTGATIPSTTTVNSSRIVTIRRKPGSVSSASSDSLRSVSPKPGEEAAGRRMSLLMSPAKSGETETQRSVRARHVRSTRRSTQGISNEEMEEAKKLLHANNSARNALSQPGVQSNENLSMGSTQITAPSDLIGGTESNASVVVSTRDSDKVPIGRAIDSLSKFQRSSRVPTDENASDRVSKYSSICTARAADDVPSAVSAASATTRTNLASGTNPPQSAELPITRTPSTTTVANSITTNSYNSTDLSNRIPSSPLRDKPSPELDTRSPVKSSSSDQSTRLSKLSSDPSSNLNKFGSLSRDRWSNSITSNVDYRRLYEKEKAEKERLMKELDRYTRENANLRSQLTRVLKEVSPVPDASQVAHGADELPRPTGVRHIRILRENPKTLFPL